VSFGRSVRPVSADAGEPSQTPVSDAMPPATEPKPGDLTYHDVLQGRAPAPAGEQQPPPAPAPPPSAIPAAPPPVTEPAAPQPAKDQAPPAPERTPPAESLTPGLYLQTEALGSADAADRAAAKLRGLSYIATVSPDPARKLYRVLVGPYATAAERDRALAQLQKDGYKPFRR
jgi:cell division septation protein DedD